MFLLFNRLIVFICLYLLTFLKVSLKVLDIGTSDRILQKFYELMYYIFQFSVEE